MKSLSKTILLALCALPGLAFSGEPYCDFQGQGGGSDCHTGYIFAYGGGFGGYNVDGHEPVFPSSEKIIMDSGTIFGGGAGIYTNLFKRGRIEVERLHAQNDIGQITSDIYDGRGYINYGFTGQMETDAFMLNVLKEIPFCKYTGYIGGGIGYAQNTITVYNPNIIGTNVGTNEVDDALAYQFIAGVDIPVTKSVDLFFQYKMLGVGESHYERLDFVIDSHITHNVVFGARLSF
ncbi:MAG: hypothetical protein P1U89_06990 [Verrucomicrobiales bacterium]|nr:hypothetical protein [Verrucomicrobiales bacterium]